jgi:putative two-component system response regulator
MAEPAFEAGPAQEPTPARILVIDDDAVVRRIVADMLERLGYEVVVAISPEEALATLDDPGLRLVISDIVMPGLSGFELTEVVRLRRPSLPVLLITGAGTEANLTEALASGAAGLIAKPFAMQDLHRHVEAVLGRAERSEREVRQRFVPGVLANVLANVLEARDGAVRGHCDRLTTLAERLSDRLGLDREEIETILLGALLHDIGKIGIPDSILLKPGSLDAGEWTVMRSHTEIGDRLLAPYPELDSVRQIVRHHHERWDGAGYPDGLSGEAIPISARVVAVADAIEAMSVRRPYRDALSLADVTHELESGRGGQWDPIVIDCALELIKLGGVAFGLQGTNVVPIDYASPVSDEELGRFAETRVADLVRTVASLDPAQLASASALDWPNDGLDRSRRREALAVLSALRAAMQPGL